MRSELVFTHRVCNQNCGHCLERRAVDDANFSDGRAVRRRIDSALGAGARELVLTGGEPTMRSDLPELIAWARARGARIVTLETNGTLLDGTRARALRQAGLDRARVNLAGAGEALDAVTRDPGGAARTIGGLRALLEAGVATEVAAAIVRATIAMIPPLPDELAVALEGAPPLRGIVLTVPVSAPEPSLLVDYAEAARAILAASASAKRRGTALRLAPDSGPPPCVLPRGARVDHLFALTPGAPPRDSHLRVDACARCRVADRCPGFSRAYLASRPLPPLTPIDDERSRRRLSVISSVDEQVQRELVQPNRYPSRETGEPVEEALVRVSFHCNQSCRFCFVSTHLPAPPAGAVERAIREAAAAGAQITLTGGEPTLNPRLPGYLRLARALTTRPVALQTNAVELDDPSLLARLLDAGLTQAQVSLHAARAEISDAITEAPGTFARTILGLDALHASGVTLAIVFVFCRQNLDELSPLVRLVAARWPRAILSVAFVAPSSDVVPRDPALIPRYADVVPPLLEAIAEAARLGVEIGGFESMCGLPLCLVPPEARARATVIPAGYDRGEFVKPAACSGCALSPRCYGLRRGYHELYGDGELRTVAAG